MLKKKQFQQSIKKRTEKVWKKIKMFNFVYQVKNNFNTYFVLLKYNMNTVVFDDRKIIKRFRM